MRNDDILKSLSYTLDLNRPQIAEIAKLAGYEPKRGEIEEIFTDEKGTETTIDGRKVEKDVSHELTAHFLDGLIFYRRGKSDNHKPRPVELPVNNNAVLKKLRVAFKLREEDIVEILQSTGFTVTKTELSALFRAEDHRNYRKCGDQLLRYFLKGLAEKFKERSD